MSVYEKNRIRRLEKVLEQRSREHHEQIAKLLGHIEFLEKKRHPKKEITRFELHKMFEEILDN